MSLSTFEDAVWIREAKRMESPHFSERPTDGEVELIVIHCISLPKGSENVDTIHALFLGNLDTAAHESFSNLDGLRVSAHLMIDRTGLTYQYVPFDKVAWHAGESSWRGRKNCNQFSIGIELQGTDEEAFEEAQYVTLGRMLRTLFVHYPRLGLQSVVGHCHIAPGRKTDPGPHFDWARVSRELHTTGR